MKLKLSKEFEEYLQNMTKRQLPENHKRFFKNLKNALTDMEIMAEPVECDVTEHKGKI